MNNDLRQFQTDYIISWDFSKEDAPCVMVGQLRRDEENTHLVMDLIGHNFGKTGCISLRQILSDYDEMKRHEAERMKDAEALRKTFGKATEKTEEANQ